MRKPNTKCLVCGENIYRRPNEIKKGNVYCSKNCMWEERGVIPEMQCKNCNERFKPGKRTSKFCSRACSNVGRKGIKYTKGARGNKSRKRLEVLKNKFNFESCMIEGCNYCRTYDVHRHIEGKHGGKYEIGNMFAICPQHHAEITRKIIEVEKVTDCVLKISKDYGG